jgi:riboflavin kinase/FMN adenylyltransferase
MTKTIKDILPGEWVEGIVVRGRGRGKKLGFPTINLTPLGVILSEAKDLAKSSLTRRSVKKEFNFPYGIYSCEVKYKNYKQYKGLLFYGSRPTFAETNPSLEILLVQLVPQIKLGQKVQFKLMKYLRKVKKFASEKELVKQIKKDLQAI